jgi:hypothetical protein
MVASSRHKSTFHNLSTVGSSAVVHKLGAVTTQQVKESHHKALEKDQSCSPSPGALPSLNSSSSGSLGYRSLSPGCSEVFQEMLMEAAVIPSEQLPLVKEWAKVSFLFK